MALEMVMTNSDWSSRPGKIIYFSNHTSAHLTHASQNKLLLKKSLDPGDS